MPASYPDAVKTFRSIENRAGVTYDANDTKTLYAEDLDAMTDEIVAIETILGLNPEGTHTSLVDRLDAMDTSIATIPAKASESEIRAGSNDTKFITPLGLNKIFELYGSTTKMYGGYIDGVTNTNYVDLPAPDDSAINHSVYLWALVLISRGATSVADRTSLYLVTWNTTQTPDIIAIHAATGSNAPLLIDDSDKLRVKNVSSASATTHKYLVLPIYFERLA